MQTKRRDQQRETGETTIFDAGVTELKAHPKNHLIFGVPSAKSYELIRDSVQTHGVLEPLVVTPRDAIDHPFTVVDGNTRLQIAKELGIDTITVRVDPRLKAEADQAARMLENAKRKDYSWSQRAAQVEAVRAIVAKASSAWRSARGFKGRSNSEIVALMTTQSESTVYRLKTIFESKTATPEFKDLIDQKRISLRDAAGLLREIESRYEAGSVSAKRALNEAVAGLGTREKTKHTRAPRTPIYDPAPKEPEFLKGIQKQLLGWVLSEIDPKTRARLDDYYRLNQAISEFMVDARVAAASFRRKVKRLSNGSVATKLPAAIAEVNKHLRVLGLDPVRAIKQVDLDRVKRTHRTMARSTHPDLNDSHGTRERFESYQAAYERVMEICEG